MFRFLPPLTISDDLLAEGLDLFEESSPRPSQRSDDENDHPEATARIRPQTALHRRRWRHSSSGATFPVHDPATGAVLCEIADGSIADGAAALDAAVAAQASWAKVSPRDRSELLRTAYEMLVARTEDFALPHDPRNGQAAGRGQGWSPWREFFRWFAEEAVRVHGRYAVAPNAATRW